MVYEDKISKRCMLFIDKKHTVKLESCSLFLHMINLDIMAATR